MYKRSEELFKQACAVIPGGVNSPVRACRNVDCQPLFIRSGKGSHVVDVDGNEFIDFVLSWGPMILGHADEAVTRAIAGAASRGTSYGAPCPDEVALAELVIIAVHLLDEQPVRKRGYRPHYNSRYERSCKPHHLFGKLRIEIAYTCELVELCCNKQEHR